ncbi:DNA polymerase III subunits gamma and tau [Cronobacter muytjensii 530]
MLGLLHRVAMVQLSPSALGADMAPLEQRLRELARVVPPGDIQLYYQTLLIGRKELPWAPERRMGVEMTMLRALAFHPRAPLPEPEHEVQPAAVLPVVNATPAPQPQAQPPQPVQTEAAPQYQTSSQPVSPSQPTAQTIPDTTSQLLQARSQLQRAQGAAKTKKNEPAAPATARPVNNSALERLASVTERVQSRPAVVKDDAPAKKEAYRWKAKNIVPQAQQAPVATPRALKKALEHEKTPELAAKLAEEALTRDEWAAEVSRLQVPKLVEQVALNAWKEQDGQKICLHLRPSQRHLNSASAQKTLADALGVLYGAPVELTIIEDDNLAHRTPLEWRQAIYEEKLAKARESIIADANIQTLRRFFDADLDEESIRPL